MKIKVLSSFYYDDGYNKKDFKYFNEKDLENYLINIEENNNLTYINDSKISIYSKRIRSLITIEILKEKESIYKYISAGRYRKTITKDIVNNRF